MKKLLAAFSVGLVAYGAFADARFSEEKHYITPIEIDLASPLQVPFTCPYSAWRVWGFRFDLIYGRSQTVRGFDVGLAGLLYGEMYGIQATAFNWVESDVYGIELGLVSNYVRGDAGGVQFSIFANQDKGVFGGAQAALCNVDGGFYGAQLGLLNWNSGISYGWQVGFANINDNEFHGVTTGIVNLSSRAHGLMVGLVNEVDRYGDGVMIGLFNGAREFSGLQIGLFNVIQTGPLPIMTLVNANF